MIYCCACKTDVHARLTYGGEIYPHREDLALLPFWKCDTCKNFVGCHHKSHQPTKPLGNIPTKELREARNHIHSILDPIWKPHGSQARRKVYAEISEKIGHQYHTAEIRTIEEAREVYKIVKEIM